MAARKTAGPKATKFERSLPTRKNGERTDLEGSVEVQILLKEKGIPVKNNIRKSLTLKGAKVSEVFEHLDEIL